MSIVQINTEINALHAMWNAIVTDIDARIASGGTEARERLAAYINSEIERLLEEEDRLLKARVSFRATA